MEGAGSRERGAVRKAISVIKAPTAAPATPQGRPARHPDVCVPPTWAPHL